MSSLSLCVFELLEQLIYANAKSGRAIEVVPYAELFIGSKAFMDRDYTFTDIGSYSPECSFIRCSNDDKNTDQSTIQTVLQVPFDSTVYLDFWGGYDHLEKVSSWIKDWKVTTVQKPTVFSAEVNWGPGVWGPGTVMQRDFKEGTINLMGNNGGGHGTYYAFVCPQSKN